MIEGPGGPDPAGRDTHAALHPLFARKSLQGASFWLESAASPRQNAEVQPLRLFFVPLLCLLTACGGKEAQIGNNHVVEEVKLDLSKPATDPPTAPAVQPKSEEVQAAPASAPRRSESGEVAALDAWHRAQAASRQADPQGKASAAALASFGQALQGGAAAYQAQVTQKAPTALGADFQRLAQAFGAGGTAGLEQAILTGGANSATYLAWNELLAVRALELNETVRGGQALGRLVGGMAAAGYPRERILELAPLAKRVADGIGGVIPAKEYVVVKNDSYWKICSNLRKQGQPTEPGWIKLFNRRKGDNIAVGDKLRIPSTPLRIEAWRQLRFVAVFAGDLPVRIYASSSGKPESPTPLGDFTLKVCEKQPVYYPPSAPAVPYGNPENPLGERWLGFAEDKQYGLHGTNSEQTIGSFETGGCVRMHNSDVLELFDLIGPGGKVKIHP